MIQKRAPIILAGQIYLNEQLNEYLIITKNDRGHSSYQGKNFKGQMEDESFIERYLPVDVNDVDEKDLNLLLSFCKPNTKPQTGFIQD